MFESSIRFEEQISDTTLKQIYSKFSFLSFSLTNVDQVDNLAKIEKYLFDYLNKFNFITYEFTNNEESLIPKTKNKKHEKQIPNLTTQKVNVIMCVEKKCLIIKEIDYAIISKIIKKIKSHQISMINVSNKFNHTEKLMPQEYQAKEEIDRFINYFHREIKNNDFIDFTIRPILGFLIRRFFYPTSYFEDPSFFMYEEGNKFNEQEMKRNLIQALYSKSGKQFNYNINQITRTINEMKKSNVIQEFQKEEFIILRTLHGTYKANFYLVIHIKSLHIFMMKESEFNEYGIKEIEHEINFCKNYSHRCLTRFYGFVQNRGKTIGFLYEYLSNGSLKTLFEKYPEKNDSLYELMIINRLFQGIEYLQSKSLIHRDIKPLNILIDHDFLPYISDFDEVCEIIQNQELNTEMTTDLGSSLYVSPEQERGEYLSSSSDIYSFGMIIYYIYEKKDNITKSKVINKPISSNIQKLYQSCVQYNPDERMKLQEIKSKIFDEINTFSKLEEYLKENENGIQFLLENIIIQNGNNDSMKQIHVKQNEDNLIDNRSDSNLMLNLGNLYLYGIGVEKSFLKAKEYYEISGNLNNSEALLNLGYLYFNGKGVEKNYSKAKTYYELSSKQNNSEALFSLGELYYNGYGVQKNFLEAKKYFELSSTQNNSEAFNNLGNLYYYGQGVEKDYSKAKEYYELSAKQNNSEAFNSLGNLYYYGQGVEKDYSKAREYFEISAEQNNPDALFNLGHLYFNANGVESNLEKANEYFQLSNEQSISDYNFYLGCSFFYENEGKEDFLIAKDYFEASAEENNSEALLHLGTLYYYGNGVEQDYLKAKEYYELSAKQNNSFAMLNLGNMYSKGVGVKRDYLKAKEYYELSGNQNNSLALNSLGELYYYGKGVEQDYNKAREYFELSSKQNDSDALFYLGNLYYYGYGVKRDYNKAKEYFELSSKQNHSDSLLHLGDLYLNGNGVTKDYSLAKKYFELAAENINSYALLNLGNLYKNGYGVKQDYLKAKEYYELSAIEQNSDAFLYLGHLYFYGEGVEQDYLKAKEYYESSAKRNNSESLFHLGNLYYKGKGVKQDYLKAKIYFENAAKQNHSEALFYLSCIHLDIEPFFNLSKAIKYLLRCYQIHFNETKNQTYSSYVNYLVSCISYNYYCYRSANDLGLIYLICFEDLEKSIEYIKESAFGEYPFGQNNYGLINQLFLNDIPKAEHFYKRSSKHNFSLAEFNLGYLREKTDRPQESIDFYINSSKHEDDPLIFQGKIHFDERLEISKTFIICLTNLKLTDYYLSISDYEESRKYFIKSFSKIHLKNEDINYNFRFHLNRCESQNIFSYLKSFILLFPLFNLKNQPYQTIQDYINELHLKLPDFQEEMNINELSKEDEIISNKTNQNELIIKSDPQIEKSMITINNFKLIELNNKMDQMKYEVSNKIESDIFEFCSPIERINTNESKSEGIILFTKADDLFDYVIQDDNIKHIFINEIRSIIHSMETILYTPPYPILFGRINTVKPIYINPNLPVFHPYMKDINEIFYEGFGK